MDEDHVEVTDSKTTRTQVEDDDDFDFWEAVRSEAPEGSVVMPALVAPQRPHAMRVSMMAIAHSLQRAVLGRSDASTLGLSRTLQMQVRFEKEGLNRVSYALGLINMLSVTYAFGRWPEHAWVVYGAKIWLYIPFWYFRVIRRRKGKWFIVEPCWIMNCLIGFYFPISLFARLPGELRLWAFRAFFEIALGFLGWSVVVAENALIWHSLATITAILIHLVPIIVFLILRWQRLLGANLEKAWPGVFPTVEEMEEKTTTVDLFLAGLVVYAVWWVLYFVWLMTYGLDLPSKGLPTIYHNFRRRHLSLFEKTGATTMRGQACVYMVVHFFLCALSFLWSALCWWNFYVPVVWVSLLTTFCVYQASRYYMVEAMDKIVEATPHPPVQRNVFIEEDYD